MDLSEYVLYCFPFRLLIYCYDSFKSVTIPQRDDPKLEKLAKRCESCKPMGMFRSNDDEFLLCYDGESFVPDSQYLLTVHCLQSLEYMSTSTVIPAAKLEPLNGRELQNASPCIIHTCYYLTVGLSRFGMWKLGVSHRSSRATTFAAYGTVVD
jgi:hypothetical protein